MMRIADQVRIYDLVAGNYHDEVISPFEAGVDFRFRTDVRRILRSWQRSKTANQKVVIDFGCGIGEAIELVAGKVGMAAGVDFSTRMLNESRKRLEKLGLNVKMLRGRRSLTSLQRIIKKRQASQSQSQTTVLANGNLLKLSALVHTCDLAFAINSIGPPSAAQAHRMFQQIAACVRVGGGLIAVFPSLDTMYHIYELEKKHGVSPSLVGPVDPASGIYTDVYGEREKFFTPDEIRRLARDAGLLIERLEKIRYPWEMMKLSGWGYYPRSPRIWDWYVVARSRKKR